MSVALWIAIGVFLVLMFLKVPVWVSVLCSTCSYLILTPQAINSIVVVQKIITGMSGLSLLAVPFFILSGIIMSSGGIYRRIMNLCVAICGRMYGSLAQVNVLISTLMGGMSGSSLADAAMDCKTLVPEMERHGYSKAFSSVVTAVSSIITPLIPPGICMILYGSLASASIGKLFTAGITAGLTLMIASMIMNYVISRKRGYSSDRTDKVTPQEFWKALREAILPLCLPILVIGSVRIGLASATEAGALCCVFAVILGLAYKELTWKRFIDALKETVQTTGGIMIIVGAVSSLSYVFTVEKLPQTLLAFMVDSINNKWIFLLVVNIFLLFVGMFMEGNAAAVMLIPMLAPIVREYGIDIVQFGVIWSFNISMGGITPPVGSIMYVVCGATGCKIKDFVRESIPYLVMLFGILMLLTYWPQLSLWLVNLVW